MDDKAVQSRLDEWQIDEIFFRDYYEAMEDGRPTQEILQRPEVRESDKRFAKDPSTEGGIFNESRFFEEGRNVILVKHPRFCPYFEHRHAFFEMLYVVRGHCTEVTNDRTVEMRGGDLCLLAPNVVHGLRVFQDSIVINLLIRHSTFEDIFLHAIRDKSQIALFFLGNLYQKKPIRYLLYHTEQDEVLRECILEMYEEQNFEDEYSDRIICSLLTIFFNKLTRRHGKTVEIPDMEERKSPYSDEMLSYIMENYQSVTLNELAEHFHFSVPYCSKLIKTISGSSFSDLISSVRLQKGENLLSITQMSIADISEQIGYRNPETFIRAFSRAYRMTPSQYRKSKLVPQLSS